MAAIGLVALKYLDQDNAYRRRLAAWYDALLNGQSQRVPLAPGCESSRHLYQVLVDRRDEVMLALNAHRIYPGVHYRDNTFYSMYGAAKGSCPRSTDASHRLISLPLHLRLSYADVVRVSEVLAQTLRLFSSAV
jgi:dTDP-4-amino-4,6-dideoxygalactose transaminase